MSNNKKLYITGLEQNLQDYKGIDPFYTITLKVMLKKEESLKYIKEKGYISINDLQKIVEYDENQ